MATGIYCVHDKVADAIMGGLHLHQADAPAVRMFTDALLDPKTILAAHPADFVLRFVGSIEDDGAIIPEMRDVLDGGQWLRMQVDSQKAVKLASA